MHINLKNHAPQAPHIECYLDVWILLLQSWWHVDTILCKIYKEPGAAIVVGSNTMSFIRQVEFRGSWCNFSYRQVISVSGHISALTDCAFPSRMACTTAVVRGNNRTGWLAAGPREWLGCCIIHEARCALAVLSMPKPLGMHTHKQDQSSSLHDSRISRVLVPRQLAGQSI